jgi:hypothetical protein
MTAKPQPKSWLDQFCGQPFDPATKRGQDIIREWMGDVDADTVAAFLHDETAVCIKTGDRYLTGDITFTDDGPMLTDLVGGMSYADSWKEREGR